MKVVILNTADAHGGAAIASWRLLHALVEEGVDARMLVVDRPTRLSMWQEQRSSAVGLSCASA